MRRIVLALGLAAVILPLSGCLKRTIEVTSEPPGALVWINDVEVGRTPVTTDFTHYGHYDVRIRREGYEPILTSIRAKAPLYELPPVDLAAEAVPARIENKLKWNFILTPVAEQVGGAAGKEQAATDLIQRAGDMRTRIAPAATSTPAPTTQSSSEPAPAESAPAPSPQQP